MSLAFRSVLAIVLFIGFYVMALSIAAGLVLLPVAELLLIDRVHLKLGFVCVAAAAIIVWSVLPRFDRFVAPGPELLRESHPELFEVIDDVANKTGQAAPAEVFLLSDVNAFVAQRGGVMGIGSRRVMGLGLPLLQVLSVSELRAVLAHEFGHFHGGDTALGPWIYKTRQAMGRTITNLGESGFWLLQLASFPFKAFGGLFLRVTLAISRAQEYAADALAAQLEGPAALASSLRAVHGAAMAFDPYLNDEVVPVLSHGRMPPIAAGFASFLASPNIATAVEKNIQEEVETGEGDPFDSHPCLRDRLAALDAFEQRDRSTDDRPSICLINDIEKWERAVLQPMLSISVNELAAVPWARVGSEVSLPQQREVAKEAMVSLAGQALADLDLSKASVAALGRQAASGPVDDAAAHRVGTYVLQALVLVTLVREGWELESLPGRPYTATHGEQRFELNALLQSHDSVAAAKEAWLAALDAAGVDRSICV
ncbi:MAG: M48 family metallopeptidase [Myxococcota bacterium]